MSGNEIALLIGVLLFITLLVFTIIYKKVFALQIFAIVVGVITPLVESGKIGSNPREIDSILAGILYIFLMAISITLIVFGSIRVHRHNKKEKKIK